MLARMATDESWREICDRTDGWKRLRWARGQTEFATPTEFARSARINVQAYLAMERDPNSSRSRKLDLDSVIKAGRKAKVSWQWIMTGDGEPWITAAEKPGDRVREALAGVMPDEDVEQLATLAELLDRRRTGTAG